VASAPVSPVGGASDEDSEDSSYPAQQSEDASTCTSSGTDSWTRDSSSTSSTQSRSVSAVAPPTAVTSTEAGCHSEWSEAATSAAVSGPSASFLGLRSSPVSSQWELSTADNVLTSEEGAKPSVAASVSPGDGVYADISSTPPAVPINLAVPATAASAAGARPQEVESARAHGSSPPTCSLPPAPPVETAGSCSAASGISASHHSPRLPGAARGPAFGSPVPASPFGPTAEEVATSPATQVPPVSPAVPAGSFGGPLSAATGTWTLWEGASEFDFDVPALPPGARFPLVSSDPMLVQHRKMLSPLHKLCSTTLRRTCAGHQT